MGIEIERKFLIHHRMLEGQLAGGSSMLQGYLTYEPAVRVRIEHPDQGKPLSLLTIKMKGTLSRLEFNYEIPLADGVALYNECKKSISKTRFRLGRWEIDQFHGDHAGLWVAEIELESEDEHVDLPAWIRREVTEDERYSNANLVRYGIPVDCDR